MFDRPNTDRRRRIQDFPLVNIQYVTYSAVKEERRTASALSSQSRSSALFPRRQVESRSID
jgi:hypothetical protein